MKVCNYSNSHVVSIWVSGEKQKSEQRACFPPWRTVEGLRAVSCASLLAPQLQGGLNTRSTCDVTVHHVPPELKEAKQATQAKGSILHSSMDGRASQQGLFILCAPFKVEAYTQQYT